MTFNFGGFDFTDNSHRRFNPLTNSWILVSPHRASRPWMGQQEPSFKSSEPEFNTKCHLCPENVGASGDINPRYLSTFVFPNDFPAVKLNQPSLVDDGKEKTIKDRFMKTRNVEGRCFVICFSPKHNSTVPRMKDGELNNVVNAWTELYLKLETEARSDGSPYKYLHIFENKGTAMGCSNLHPHGQAWCLNVIPDEVDKEFQSFSKYSREHASCLLGDYITLESEERERIVLENDVFLVVVPYWAVWPFETLLLGKQLLHSLADFNCKEKMELVSIMKKLTTKYDNLFQTSFLYIMGLRQAPFNATQQEKDNSWFHIHFYSPLLRSATVRKFLVGFELLGEPQRDLNAEQAAKLLADLDDGVHYTDRL
ncbi:LAQU0S24e00672g1_1 [Lachancea quebecensis]|uniref:Galactose-1-phosphate uridylyltransferase n=1 Tax=Lachancea quebecensis TaxID=1654605 RepID=A0A0P1L554_9SACH|nr:LAQU0S24e00672g1_1 [Lachancea quebecensis]